MIIAIMQDTPSAIRTSRPRASAQNAKAFFNNVIDPNVIGFGTIDDIDQLAGKRGDRQSSAGQLEITAAAIAPLACSPTIPKMLMMHCGSGQVQGS